ncbi:MAG: hypothetical protein JO320_00950, partial [Alphaproteobacteria bacterium]|nr:hypothetical protein [Alphaproteobacteria bacterium]
HLSIETDTLIFDPYKLTAIEGAAALAARSRRARLAGKRVAIIHSGGNIDRTLLAEMLAEEDASIC